MLGQVLDDVGDGAQAVLQRAARRGDRAGQREVPVDPHDENDGGVTWVLCFQQDTAAFAGGDSVVGWFNVVCLGYVFAKSWEGAVCYM